MKKILYIFILISVLNTGYSQNDNSVLSNGKWYKFAVNQTGIHKIDANFLQSIGINIKNINPKNIRIFGNGGSMLPESLKTPRYETLQENAILVEGENDNRFDSNDYILFYAKGPHDWVIDTTSKTASHRQNIYDDFSYYFINIGNSLGKRIQTKPEINEDPSISINNYDDFLFHEKDQTNLFALGKQWFGENFSIENKQSFEIPFENTNTTIPLKVRIRAVVASSNNSSMNVSINGISTGYLTFDKTYNSPTSNLADTQEKVFTINNPQNKNIITLTFNGLPSAKVFLDYIELVGNKKLIANNKQFSFRNFEAANNTGTIEYLIQNSNNINQIWNVSDFINPKRITSSSANNITSFKYSAGLHEFVVMNNNDFYKPIKLDNSIVENQNLHGLKDIQYLIITNSSLKSEAERLANYHSKYSSLTTKVATIDKIYNEFSSGSNDIVGIRDFIRHLYLHSSDAKKLTYVCFFGDSSYDYKNRIEGNNNIVPTYHATDSFHLVYSYVTDDFFVMIDDTDGEMRSDDNADIASGRIPVSSVSEARSTVDKILSYYTPSSLGDWRNTVTLVADDIDADSDKNLQSEVEKIADTLKKYKPIFNLQKIYADAYRQENSSGGERYPETSNAINNAIEKGTLVFDYFGHGGEEGLASERLLDVPQIESFRNSKKLPLFITVTCELSRFDNPLRNTAGERLFLNPKGGAVSMITTTRDILISTGETFNLRLTKEVFNFDNKNLSIAQRLLNTKKKTFSKEKFFIYFFGDPAMKLAIPKPNILITKLNGKDVNKSLDTIKALSKIKLEGIVTNENNTIISNFNGVLSASVFDKSIDKQTLDNDGNGIINTFDSQESKLYKGKASVKNGLFSFSFIAPKDLKVAYGKGKVSMYAENGAFDKAGTNFNIVIGGINKNAPKDTKPPEIKVFMNDESFVDGGNTNSSPNLLIKLFDESGINTSVTAVDHDIIAYLDNDRSNPIILNDYYETELDDYKNGKVYYRLRNLPTGKHSITVKAWDTYNNSSETTLSFIVVSDSELELNHVLNYPNPFVNYTEFWFNHNKPNEPLEVLIQIFTISGKLIKTINQTVISNGNLSREINWNGLDDFGNRIGKGTYIYKLKVKSTESNLSAEKIEKLVILQ